MWKNTAFLMIMLIMCCNLLPAYAKEPAVGNSVSNDIAGSDTANSDTASSDTVSSDTVSSNHNRDVYFARMIEATKNRMKILFPDDGIIDPHERINIILDTDYASDVDDVAAVRVATSMHKLGMINLCAVGTSVEGDYSTRSLHGQLCYDGLPDIPCGWDDECIEEEGPHWEYFAWKYHDEQSYQLHHASDLYKATIYANAQRGQKTRIVVLGFLTNIEELLMDPEGYALVSQWVDSIWIDGGAYPEPGQDNNFFLRPEATTSIQYCIANSPCPLVFITNETGCYFPTNSCVMCGSHLYKLDPDCNDPVNKSYRLYEEWYEGADLRGGHMGWDAMTVWAAGLSRKTTMTHISYIDAYVYDNGVNEFILNPAGRHAILERNHNDIWWYSNELERLIDYGVTGVY